MPRLTKSQIKKANPTLTPDEVNATASAAADRHKTLMAGGYYQDHEAEEIVRAEYLKPPPGGDEPEWSRKESAELEREYQKNPPGIPYVGDEDEELA